MLQTVISKQLLSRAVCYLSNSVFTVTTEQKVNFLNTFHVKYSNNVFEGIVTI